MENVMNLTRLGWMKEEIGVPREWGFVSRVNLRGTG